jgi:raffinose/stachyose/melibiose transport system substrate-binding protein
LTAEKTASSGEKPEKEFYMKRKGFWFSMMVVVVLAVAGLVACKKSGSQDITLNLWHIGTQETRKAAIDSAARRFEEANPGVKIVVSIYENDPYKTKLKTVSGDEFPDVLHSWGGGWLKSFVDSGLVYDITELSKPWIGNVSAEYQKLSIFDNKVYGSPYNIGATPLYYNKALFEKFGLAFPQTWSELEKVCETFLANGIIPFALGNRSKWPGAQHFVLLSMRLGGPDIFQRALDGQTNFVDPVFIRAGEMLKGMVDKGWFPDGVNGINYDTGGSRMMFYTEQCAMIVQTTGFVASCKSENIDFYTNKLAIGSYPAIEGTPGKNTDVLGGANSFSVANSSKNKEMATKLVEFLATDKQFQQDIVASGALSALQGISTSDSLVNSLISFSEKATFMQNYIDQTLSPVMGEVHKDTVQALFGGTMTPLQAAEEMQRAFEAEQ